MAVPTISAVAPAVGPSMGRAMLDITGTGFRLATVEPTGPTTKKPPSVEVEFSDGASTRKAIQVQVLSDTRVAAVTPIFDPGLTTITLRNLDNTGSPIVGEEVVLPAAYTFVTPKLTQEFPSDLQRIVRQLIRELKRQVLPDKTITKDGKPKKVQRVSLTVHTDYDEQTGATLHTAKLSELPGIVIKGPDLQENRFYSINDRPDFEEGTVDGDFVTTRVPYTVDLLFDVFGFSDKQTELLNLMHALTVFFESNKFIEMDRDPNDPSKGSVRYEMDFQSGGQFKASRTTINPSNLRSFDGSIVIRGFDIEGLAGIEAGDIAGVPRHEIVERSRDQGTNETQLDPTEQTAISFGPLVVSSIKSPGDC